MGFLIGCGTVLFGQYFISYVTTGRNAAEHSRTAGRLSQIRFAVDQYHDIYGMSPILPPIDPDHANENWRIRLLSILEGQERLLQSMVTHSDCPLWFRDTSDSGDPSWTSFVLITFDDVGAEELMPSEQWAIVKLPQSGISWLSSDLTGLDELKKRLEMPSQCKQSQKSFLFLASDGTIGALQPDGMFLKGDPIQLLTRWAQSK